MTGKFTPPARNRRLSADEVIEHLDTSTPLAEEWFEGQEGLQYFDSKAVLPYYLVNAGRSLIFRTTAPPEPSLAALQDLKEIVEKLKGEKAAIPASLGDLQSTSKSNVPETQNPHIDADTTLSSKEEDANENWSVIEKDPTNTSQKGGNQRGINAAVPNGLTIKQVLESPIGFPIPLKLQFEYRQETFQCSINKPLHKYHKNLEALSRDPGKRQDICINIFYNGELTHSRIVKQQDGPRNQDKGIDFSGRRIHRQLEVPWVIIPLEKNAPITDSNFEARWDKVNQLLATEVDEWGSAGGKINLFRSPMGEYLEAMSKLPMPEGARKWNENGGRAGIIDLVITTGWQHTNLRTKSINLLEPTRKLYEGYVGKPPSFYSVPEEEREHKQEEKKLAKRLKAQIAAWGPTAADPSKVDSLRRKARRSRPIPKATRPGHISAASSSSHTKQYIDKEHGSDGIDGFGGHNTAHEAADSFADFGLDGSGNISMRNTKAQSYADNEAPLRSSFRSEAANAPAAAIRRSSSRGKLSAKGRSSESSGSTIEVAVPKFADEFDTVNSPRQKRSKVELEGQTTNSQISDSLASSPGKTTKKSKNSRSKKSAASKPTKQAIQNKNATNFLESLQTSPSVKENTDLLQDEFSPLKSPAEQAHTLNDPALEPKKKKAPSRAVSVRELKAVLPSHEASEKIDSSFGASFLQTGTSNRPVTRNTNARQAKDPSPLESKPTTSQFLAGVTATVKGPILTIKGKGVNGAGSKNSKLDELANSTKAGEPIGRAWKAIRTAKVPQMKVKAIGNADKSTKPTTRSPAGETGKSSNEQAKINGNGTIVQNSSDGTSILAKKPKRVSKWEVIEDADDSAVKADTTETDSRPHASIVKPRFNAKPNISINTTLANRRSYSENSQGLKTPTPKTDTFDMRKGTDSKISTCEPSSADFVMQDETLSSHPTALQPVVPSLFDSHTSAVRTSTSQSWGLSEQPTTSIFTSSPLRPLAAQISLQVVGQQDQDLKSGAKDTKVSVPASNFGDKKGKGKESTVHTSVLQRGDEKDEGNRTVVSAPAFKLWSVKGKNKEKVVLMDEEDMTIPEDGNIGVKDFAVLSEDIATPSNRKGKGKEVELSDQETEEGDDVAARTTPAHKLWLFNSICRDSFLTYASDAACWDGIKFDDKSRNFYRNIPMEREGLFRASGILFGVRFVIGLGADEPERKPECERAELGDGNADIDVEGANNDAEELDIYDA